MHSTIRESSFYKHFIKIFHSVGVCTNGTAPSVSSINRILRNRAAERAAAEFARNYQLAAAATAASVHYPLTPHHHPTPPTPFPGINFTALMQVHLKLLQKIFNQTCILLCFVAVGHPPTANPAHAHQLYAAWAAAAAAAALATQQHQPPPFWSSAPLTNSALFQQQSREEYENNKERG